MNCKYNFIYKDFYNNNPERFFRIKDLKKFLNNFKDNDTIEFTAIKREDNDIDSANNVVKMHINGKSHLNIYLDKNLKYYGTSVYYEAYDKEETDSYTDDSITNEVTSYEDLVKEIKELKEENSNMKKFIKEICNIIHGGTN